MNTVALEIKRVDKTLEHPIAELFRILQNERNKTFHPHPFTDEEAKKHAQYIGKDLYYVVLEGDHVLGYGMLRGWDEGYEVPSLGIVIHPSVRGTGLAKLFMDFLHTAARRRGARKVRLKVYPDNTAAVNLYKKLGYVFESKKAGQLVGFVDL